MTNSADIALADRLGRGRAQKLPVLGVFFIIQQIAFFSNPPAERLVDHVRIGAWVMLTAVLLLILATRGFWFRPAAQRAMIDDEPTRANRSAALHWGFVAAMVAAIVIYVVEGAAQFTTREAIHLIVSAGMITALVRFWMLERRGYA